EVLALEVVGAVRQVVIEDGAPYCWSSDSGVFFRPESGGVLADWGVHYLDLVQCLLGELTPVSYTDDWGGGGQANCEFHLRTAQGIPVRLRLSRDRLLRNEMVLVGDKGDLGIQKDNFAACFWSPKGAAVRGSIAPVQPFPDPGWPPTLASGFANEL